MLIGILLLAYAAVLIWTFAELTDPKPRECSTLCAVAALIVMSLAIGGALENACG